MPEELRLREIIGENRAKIDSLENELGRVRERLHEIESEFAALRYLGTKVGEMASAVKELGDKLELISRRALERPTARSWQALASMVAAGVAVVALIVAVTHSH